MLLRPTNFEPILHENQGTTDKSGGMQKLYLDFPLCWGGTHAPNPRVVQGSTVFLFHTGESPGFRIKLVLSDYFLNESINTRVRPCDSRLAVPSVLRVKIAER